MITVIGDVHGKYDQYYDIVSKSEYSICLGDFGFSSAWNKLGYSNLNPKKHKVLCGNHDSYDIAPNSPFYLGDYGVATLNKIRFFFVRGGLSIDRVYRVGEELSGGQKTWWSQEELNFHQMTDCIDAYKEEKPDILLAHVPPQRFIDNIHGNKDNSILQRFNFHEGFRENTSLLMDELLNHHKPKLIISGHHHKSYTETKGKMKFVSLAELETYEIN
jgi:predicted phosphodiesterase